MSQHKSIFEDIAPVRFEGTGSDNPLAFRYYEKDRIVLGTRMEDQLRIAACYWHNFCWTGLDPFGGQTFLRPWFEGGAPLALAEH
jgi:xylose isomerase